MTRILVQRGSAGSSSNPSRSSPSPGSSSSSRAEPQVNRNASQVPTVARDEEVTEEIQEQAATIEIADCSDGSSGKDDNVPTQSDEPVDKEDEEGFKGFGGLMVSENVSVGSEGMGCDTPRSGGESPHPPPPPVPPPKPCSGVNSEIRRSVSGSSSVLRIGATRRGAGSRPVASTRSSPTGSRPSSPRSHGETEGYNSADEQSPCFMPSYGDVERERQFEVDLRRAKGLEVRRMLEDGNCLFRAVADQVYGDSDTYYDVTRQMCIDYMEKERDHFSQFVTESFTSYCKRKRRDKVYGNNVEIQALAEIYNRPIHIYSYSTEPINIFHGNYNTDTPPIRLSYHHGNHYNSLVDPRRLTVGVGLGFSSLRGRNVDKEQVKAAIKAQQDQQIDSALIAEGKFYSDIELTEKEIERMVMEASRVEYLSMELFKPPKDSSTSTAEPSSSGAKSIPGYTSPPESVETILGSGVAKQEKGRDQRETEMEAVLSSSIQMVLSMGFSYMQAMEAYSIFGDDVDSMVCYLLDTSSSSRRKGKATE